MKNAGMNESLGLASGFEARLPRGFLCGNYQEDDAASGCTVLLSPKGAVGAVAVRGGAPATRETDLLDPINTVNSLNAVVLSGGSAFGLDTAAGVMAWLEEKKYGISFANMTVPIVSGACIFDLNLGIPGVRPDATWGRKACENAEHRLKTGNIGAGMGATVGKILGFEWAMKSGLGAASFAIGELTVSAVAVVNALGNVYSGQSQHMLAGTRDPERPMSILDPYQALLAQNMSTPQKPNPLLEAAGDENNLRSNTTLCCVLTNADLTKAEANRVASMAHDGFARAIDPVHTANDGDTVFVMAAGDLKANPDLIGILAARATEAAIINAVVDAESAYGLPASRDIFKI